MYFQCVSRLLTTFEDDATTDWEVCELEYSYIRPNSGQKPNKFEFWGQFRHLGGSQKQSQLSRSSLLVDQ